MACPCKLCRPSSPPWIEANLIVVRDWSARRKWNGDSLDKGGKGDRISRVSRTPTPPDLICCGAQDCTLYSKRLLLCNLLGAAIHPTTANTFFPSN